MSHKFLRKKRESPPVSRAKREQISNEKLVTITSNYDFVIKRQEIL
jgi:hypothetical protein